MLNQPQDQNPLDTLAALLGFGQQQQAPPPIPSAAPKIIPNYSEQQEIVSNCQYLKTTWKTHKDDKKNKQLRAEAYKHNKMYDDTDLLPRPSSVDADKSNKSRRPQVFFPITCEQYKLLYSYVKLSLFPNDEDYFRIRAQKPEGVALEDDLTEAVKQKFKRDNITRKLGNVLQNMIIYGCASAYPTFSINPVWKWEINKKRDGYNAVLDKEERALEIEAWNPIHFYVDPNARNVRHAKWAYFDTRKFSEIRYLPSYFNLDQLERYCTKTPMENDPIESGNIRQFEGLNNVILDIDENVYIDHYYFPILELKSSGKTYHNIWVSVGMDKVLCEFRPVMMPNGNNPIVFGTWSDDTNSPYGTGPLEEMADLQRLMNIVGNYLIELMARIGNRFAISEDVDTTQAFGLAAGIFRCKNPGRDVVPLTGNLNELEILQQFMMNWKAEMQMLSGAQAPNMGGSNVKGPKKTATEIQVVQENSISIMREVLEHVALFIQDILQQSLGVLAEIYPDPIQIRMDDEATGQPSFKTVDFSVFRGDDFILELTGANPAQSKQQQLEYLQQLATAAAQNPNGLLTAAPVIRKMGALLGEKDAPEILNQIQEAAQKLQQQQMQAQQGMMQQQGQQQGFPPHAA